MIKSKSAIVGVLALTVPLVACGGKATVAPSPLVQTGPTIGSQQVFEGAIESISPSSIVVGGQRIVVDSATAIRSGSMPLAFADLRVGARSRVAAQFDGSVMHGTLVEVVDDVGTPAQFQGVVANMSRDGDTFQFKIGRQLVRGNQDTQVVDENGAGAAPSLSDGRSVDLDALQRAEYAYSKRITVRRSDTSASAPPSPTTPGPTPPGPTPPGPSPTPPGPSPNEITISGILGSISGVCPLLMFPVSGQVVVTNTSTVYLGGSCSSVAAGVSAQIKGTPNGATVVARQITIR